MVVFGTVDLGRAWALRNRLTNMAREGAFYAQQHPRDISGCSPASITSAALGEDPTVKGATVSVTFPGGSPVANNCGAVAGLTNENIYVTVSVPMKLVSPLVGSVTGDPVMVSGTVEVVVLV
jgi:hypothetical protein